MQPSGVKSFIVQVRAQGRMRKVTLGRFPELPLDAARREAAAVLARLWGGEDVTPPRKARAPLFRDFAARYRERRRHRWKPSSLRTFDIYLRARLMPAFGRLRLDAIDHVKVSAWFDAASVERPGAANRAFEILRAMLASARQWGELGAHVPDACANIVRNPRRPVARFLRAGELERLGAALESRRESHPCGAGRAARTRRQFERQRVRPAATMTAREHAAGARCVRGTCDRLDRRCAAEHVPADFMTGGNMCTARTALAGTCRQNARSLDLPRLRRARRGPGMV